MARRLKSNIGIEITSDEVRAVCLASNEDKPSLISSFHVNLPAGAVTRGRINTPASISAALDPWLKTLALPGPSGTCIGISSGTTVLRIVEVPPAPQQEFATIVAGEVEYYKIVSESGAYGFARLSPRGKQQAETNSVLIAAVQRPIVAAAAEIAQRSKLSMGVLEPTQFARLRLALAVRGPRTTACFTIVGHQSTDIAFVHEGELCFYRRLDKGADQIATSTAGKFHDSAVQLLTGEVRHALNYVEREFEEFAAIEALDILYSEPSLVGLEDVFAKELSIFTRLVAPIDAVKGTAGREGISDEEQYKFSGALGLAMRGMIRLDPSIPDIDLYSGERKEVTRQVQRRNLSASIGIAAAALFLGAVGVLLYGHEISKTKTATEQALALAKDYRSQSFVNDEARTKDLSLYHQLRQTGVPVTAVMDSLSANLGRGVGLRSVRVNPDFTYVLDGEATDVQSILETVQNLQAQPILLNTKLESFNGSDKAAKVSGLTFTAKGAVVSTDRIADVNSPDPIAKPEVSK